MIGDDNAAFSTVGILAGPEGIVRRDIAAFASGRWSRGQRHGALRNAR
jgi:hypothetical protein